MIKPLEHTRDLLLGTGNKEAHYEAAGNRHPSNRCVRHGAVRRACPENPSESVSLGTFATGCITRTTCHCPYGKIERTRLSRGKQHRLRISMGGRQAQQTARVRQGAGRSKSRCHRHIQHTPAIAAQKATQTIPVVFGGVGDPVGSGVVSNLNRSGGNVTGISILATELSAKRLELLEEIVPGANPVAMFWNDTNPGMV